MFLKVCFGNKSEKLSSNSCPSQFPISSRRPREPNLHPHSSHSQNPSVDACVRHRGRPRPLLPGSPMAIMVTTTTTSSTAEYIRSCLAVQRRCSVSCQSATVDPVIYMR
ncbi:hypothetical protein GQ55_1G157700 [Panicum hallii var. hallii]|uniref:Uncharacterized protein n=1 Tax=Panicum hallii var. hallii TaxID=1504633 RepID=A0A2T7F5K9_9POAL|nr:hypothetical protein GQ55_1G157700 [Panicum hallii var. hallii]